MRQKGRRERPDLPHQARDRTGGAGPLPDAGQVESGDGATDVEGDEVVGERGAPREPDAPVGRIHSHRGREDDFGARQPGQRDHVDLQLRGPVLTGDEPGHHPGVDGDRRVEHHRHPGLGPRAHHHPAEDLDVGMATAHQDDVGPVGRVLTHDGQGATAKVSAIQSRVRRIAEPGEASASIPQPGGDDP